MVGEKVQPQTSLVLAGENDTHHLRGVQRVRVPSRHVRRHNIERQSGVFTDDKCRVFPPKMNKNWRYKSINELARCVEWLKAHD